MSLPRLRAPKEHGQILAVPSLNQVGALLAGNWQILHSANNPSSSRSLSELRALARREVLAASSQYHHEANEPIPDSTSDVWLVAGHQPELFHPGVWFKNFALYHLARKHGTTSINLVIDTDTAKPALLHAPSEGRLIRVPFDRSSPETPYEERTVEEESTFAQLPMQMEPIVARWKFEPMLATFWREVMAQTKRTPLLGERFAAARRAMERRWGCVQREVPMSRVCQTEAFAWFGCAILDRLPEFYDVYNQTVHEYRRTHGIRSRSHPVPDLTRDGDWFEAPFWAWRKGQARRGKLFVRQTRRAWELRVGGELWPALPGNNLDVTVEAWRSLEAHGYKIRSRALTTTMFARLFLADVFIHGIGGGLYDELTDHIMQRFFGIQPPGFLVLTATLLLPLPHFPTAAHRSRDLARQQRDLIYKPERFVKPTPAVEPLIRAKQEWIGRDVSTHPERVERFERIREINASLLPFVEPQMQRLRLEREECGRQVELHDVNSRRDYAFCLYPEEMLRTFFSSEGAQQECPGQRPG